MFDNKKYLAVGTLAAAMTTSGVLALPTTVYNQDGLELTLEMGDNGEVTLLARNNSDSDMHDARVKNQEIEGLTLEDKDIFIGEIRAGEEKEVEFQYYLDKAATEIVEDGVKNTEENNEENGSNNEDQKKEKDTQDDNVITKKSIVKSHDNNKDNDSNQHKKVQTGDSSNNQTMTIAIPVIVAGVAGVMYLLVRKKTKARKTALGLLVASGLSAGLVGGSYITKAANGDNINPDTGRLISSIPLQGDVKIDGNEYEYAGEFLFELDSVATEDIEEETLPNVNVTYDNTLNAGQIKITNIPQNGYQKVTITKTNGKETNRKVDELSKIEADDYEVVVGTKEVTKEENKLFDTEYISDETQNIGYTHEDVKGQSGKISKTLSVNKSDIENKLKDIIEGNRLSQGTHEVLDIVDETVSEDTSVNRVVRKGVKEVLKETVAASKTYEADTTRYIGDKNTVKTKGVDGISEHTYIHSLDKKGNIVKSNEPSNEKVLQAPQNEVILVPALEQVDESIPFSTKIVPNANKWVGEESVLSKGQDGLRRKIYKYFVDDTTGELGKKTEDSSTEVKPAIDEVIERGTKRLGTTTITEEESIKHKTNKINYVNDISEIDTLSKLLRKDNYLRKQAKSGKREFVTIAGADGTKEITYQVISDKDGNVDPTSPKIKLSEKVIKQPVDEEITVRNYTVKAQTIKKQTEYIADDSMAIGQTKVVKQGQDGVNYNVALYKDPQLKTIDAQTKIVKTPVVNEVIAVGTKETVKDTLSYATVVKEDNSQWDNYEVVDTEGKDGTGELTYTYTVDKNTGKLSNKKLKGTRILKSPVDEVIIKGTKTPDFKDVKVYSNPILPGPVVTENFVSDKKLDELSVVSDFKSLRQEFDNQAAGKEISDDAYLKNKAKNGEEYRIERIAYDPDNGQEVKSYKRKLVENGSTEPVPETRVKFNISLGEQRDAEPSYAYKKDSSLPFGEVKTTKEATIGREQEILSETGKSVWVGVTKPVAGVKTVGNIEVTTENIPMPEDIVVGVDEWKFEGDDIVQKQGYAGKKEVTKEYDVNPINGDLTNPTISNEKTLQEPQANEIIKGALVRHGSIDNAEAQALYEAINNYREELGLERLAPMADKSQGDLAATLYGERHVNLGKLEHVNIGGWDSAVVPAYNAQGALAAFKNSPAHNNIITNKWLTNLSVSAYRVGNRVYFTVGTFYLK